MVTLWHMNPFLGRHKIYNKRRPFLGHHYYIISLSDVCLGVEKKIFKEINCFHYETYFVTPRTRNLLVNCTGYASLDIALKWWKEEAEMTYCDSTLVSNDKNV